MLRYRLASAALIISAALIVVALDSPWPFGDAAVALLPGATDNPSAQNTSAENTRTGQASLPSCTGCWMVGLGFLLFFGSAIECVGMCAKSPLGSISAPALIGCGGVMLAAALPAFWPLSGMSYPSDCLLGRLGWPLAAGALAQLGCFAWYMPTYRAHSGDFSRAILAGWVSVYFGGCFAFSVALRLTGTSGWGLFLVVGVITITKFSDAGAYFTGRAVGRTKLCPAVSPGKTVEGLLGGMLTAVLVAWVIFGTFAPLVFGSHAVRAHPLGCIVLGILLTLAGVCGDLLESIFKREMSCKDSGRLLPGLGGLWDVTDSLLPAMVVAYLVIVAGLIQGPGQ